MSCLNPQPSTTAASPSEALILRAIMGIITSWGGSPENIVSYTHLRNQ